jgi:hypothetical protein
LLHELVPKASVAGLLVNPVNPILAETEATGALSAARSFGITLHVLNASNEGDFEGVFAKLTELGALVVGADPLFASRSELLGQLAARPTRRPQFLRTGRSPQPAGSLAMAATPSILIG